MSESTLEDIHMMHLSNVVDKMEYYDDVLNLAVGCKPLQERCTHILKEKFLYQDMGDPVERDGKILTKCKIDTSELSYDHVEDEVCLKTRDLTLVKNGYTGLYTSFGASPPLGEPIYPNIDCGIVQTKCDYFNIVGHDVRAIVSINDKIRNGSVFNLKIAEYDLDNVIVKHPVGQPPDAVNLCFSSKPLYGKIDRIDDSSVRVIFSEYPFIIGAEDIIYTNTEIIVSSKNCRVFIKTHCLEKPVAMRHYQIIIKNGNLLSLFIAYGNGMGYLVSMENSYYCKNEDVESLVDKPMPFSRLVSIIREKLLFAIDSMGFYVPNSVSHSNFLITHTNPQ